MGARQERQKAKETGGGGGVMELPAFYISDVWAAWKASQRAWSCWSATERAEPGTQLPLLGEKL